MSKYAGTQTEKPAGRFRRGVPGPEQVHYFVSNARKEGFVQIAALFPKTAGNEKERAKMWFKEPAGIGSTAENPGAAADGENYK